MQPFREVKVWEKSHQLSLHVFRATAGFPVSEQFGLSAQLRRIAVSVTSRIAEGCGRGGDRDLARLLDGARGFASELESLLLLARDLDYLDESEHASIALELLEVQKMLSGFLKTVRARLEEAKGARGEKAAAMAA